MRLSPFVLALAAAGGAQAAGSPIDALARIASVPQKLIGFGLTRVLGFNETQVNKILERDDTPVVPLEHAGMPILAFQAARS
jgi:hypothetical protein